MDAFEFRLLNEFQRDFPLVERPFAKIAEVLGSDEATVLATLREQMEQGAVSRIGAVVAPRCAAASTLAAMAVPPAHLERVAALVSAFPEVNHNYQREHEWNLWFVLQAEDGPALDRTITAIEAASGLPVLRLGLEQEYHIDLGFDLAGRGARPARTGPGAQRALAADDRALLAAAAEGLDLVPRPFARIAMRSGLSEQAVLAKLREWCADGLVKRFGVIVRHHELGYGANAMCVWNVPDAAVQAVGRALASEPAVTLCYRRTRVAGAWPYNLYCMIHGRAREEVLAQHADISGRLGLAAFEGRVLFSLRRFKQRGARYAAPAERRHG